MTNSQRYYMNNKYGEFYSNNYFGMQPSAFELQLGFELISLVQQENKDLLLEITSVKNQLDDKYGIPIPKVHIRDNMLLASCEYEIFLFGLSVGKGEVRPKHVLYINPGNVSESEIEIKGKKITEPVMGYTAYSIEKENTETLKEFLNAGYIMVSASRTIGKHLYKIITENRTKILDQSLVNTLINKVRPNNPDVIDDIFFNHQFKTSSMKKILNTLIAANYSVRDMNTILEAIADNIDQSKDPEFLTEKIKEKLPGPVEEDTNYYGI